MAKGESKLRNVEKYIRTIPDFPKPGIMFRDITSVLQDADGLQQRLGAEYQSEVAKYNKALSDSIHNYLNVFNKDKKYAMILAKQGDNILYADKANDITDVVVKGLNKAYKGMKK